MSLKKQAPYMLATERSIRVIIDTDAYNQFDDQFALAHALMTPKLDVLGIVAEQYGTRIDEYSEQHSYEEICNILNLMDLAGEIPVFHGAAVPLRSESDPIRSEGAEFIIREALREDPRPLFVCNLGAVTNLACAYLMEPEIENRIHAIWIGGSHLPEGEFEFNQNHDICASNVLMKSRIPLWQVTKAAYRCMVVPMSELYENVHPCGKIGRYLTEYAIAFQNHIDDILLNRKPGYQDFIGRSYGLLSTAERATNFGGEIVLLGDSPAVGLLLRHDLGRYEIRSAPRQIFVDGACDRSAPGSRDIRVYYEMNSSVIFRDMYSKFRMYYGK